MSDQPFLKCACQNCGGSIEFPAPGVGLSVQCPHCAQKTLLTAPAAPAFPAAIPVAAGPVAPPRRPVPQPGPPATRPVRGKSPVLGVVLVLLVVSALAAGVVWFLKFGRGSKGNNDADVDVKNSSPQTSGSRTTAAPAAPSDSIPTAVPDAKSIDDLKPGAVKLEKAKSGSLFYAVGTVRNDSAHQRFGVKVEIEFTDAKGQPAGRTTDYTQVIEPRQEWRFRALVLDAKAASGRVVSVKEDN